MKESKPIVVLDMYVLAQGIRTGVYRVCHELFTRLSADDRLEVRYFVRPKDRGAIESYLMAHGLGKNLIVSQPALEKLSNIYFVSPFGVPPNIVSVRDDVRHIRLVYDLIAIRHPEFFHEEAFTEVNAIMDSLSPRDLIFTISDFTRYELLAYRPDLDPRLVSTMPMGVSELFHSQCDIATKSVVLSRHSLAETQYIMSVATVEARKNFETVVRAFATYCDEHADSETRLVIAGMQGWKSERVEAALRSVGSLAERVVFLGYVDDEELHCLLGGCRCFLYLSRMEGFGLPPLEAMAAGVPVICANNSSLPEVVGDAGVLVDAENYLEAADALAAVLQSDDVWGTLSRKARARANLFSWQSSSDHVSLAIRSHHATQEPNPSPARQPERATVLSVKRGSSGTRYDLDEAPQPVVESIRWPGATPLPKRKSLDSRQGGKRTNGLHPERAAGMPLISFVTVVKDRVGSIERTIRSVLAQSYRNVEYIVVDGASTDGTLEVIDRYADHIDYYVSEPDLGLYHALNKGVELATGDLICVLNSDDWLTADAASVAANYYSDEPLFVLTAARVVSERGVPIHQWVPSYVHPGSYLECPNVCHNGIYATRSAYDLTGPYDESYKIAADFKWIMKALGSGVRFVYTDEITVSYELGGASSNRALHALEAMRIMGEKFPFLSIRDKRLLHRAFYLYAGDDFTFRQLYPEGLTHFARHIQYKHEDSKVFQQVIAYAINNRLVHPVDLVSGAETVPRMNSRLKERMKRLLLRFPRLFRASHALYRHIRSRHRG